MIFTKGISKCTTVLFRIILILSLFGCNLIDDEKTDDDNSGNNNSGNNSSSNHVVQELAKIKRTAESHNTYIIEVNADENIAPQTLEYPGAINVTIILKGVGGNRTLRLSSNGTMFTVRTNVTLVLDQNISLQGHNQNTRAIVYVYEGSLIMNTGSAITNNTNTSSFNGGGIWVSSGTFKMTGGTISNNKANEGGGVYLGSSSTFEMTGGIISENTASDGAGIHVRSSSLYLNGGDISSNIASKNGGGVYISSYLGSSFTQNGGTISNNSALKSGGGVYVTGTYGKFTMLDGNITGNIAAEYGGGVNIFGSSSVSSGQFNKTGGIITGYTSDSINGNVVKDGSGILSQRGHAIYLSRGSGFGGPRQKNITSGAEDDLLASNNSTGGSWD